MSDAEDVPQDSLFGAGELAEVKAEEGPAQTIYVHFDDLSAVEKFGRVIGLPVTTQTRYLSFPIGKEHGAAWRASATVDEPDEEDEIETGFSGGSQGGLFGDAEWWEEFWGGMPEFDQQNLAPKHSIQIDFETRRDVEDFARLLDQTITAPGKRTRSVWYPEAEIGSFANKRYVGEPPINPQYPVYIISKGRADTRLTAKALEKMGVPYHICVEPLEYDLYEAVIDPEKILLLPFDNLGLGSIPARNFVWEHAISTGAKRHWILDDNIDGFYRLNKNLKVPVTSGNVFRAAEAFVDRFENVAIAAFHYFMFASRKTKMPPFTLNSRGYSCILIRNDLPYRWRGRYNEDTDLSIRALKDGHCTVLFLAFLAMKSTTMTMKGGNTEALYKLAPGEKDGRLLMAESLRDQHPDITKITRKWGRWQHHVDYSGFKKNRLVYVPGLVVPDGVDNHGMRLNVTEEKT